MQPTIAKRWTPSEESWLKARREAGASIEVIANELGRTFASVHAREQRPNIRKSQQRLNEMFQATRPELEMPEAPPPDYVLHEREVRLSIPRTTPTQIQFVDPLAGYSAGDHKRRGISVQDALEICAIYGGKPNIHQITKAYRISKETARQILNGSFFDHLIPAEIAQEETMWTDERIEQLTYLWKEGATASEIGSVMTLTRSAVLGKVHRLRLPPRLPQMSDEQRESSRLRRAEANLTNRREARGLQRIDIRTDQSKPLPEFLGSMGIPFADLRDFKHGEPNQCRYIADSPPGPQYLACGNETLPGASWCPNCHKITHFKAMNISEQDRNRRAAHFRKMGRNPQIIITSPSVVAEVA